MLLGDGAGGFSGATSFAGGTGPGGIALGDMNDDARMDLSAANFNSNKHLDPARRRPRRLVDTRQLRGRREAPLEMRDLNGDSLPTSW